MTVEARAQHSLPELNAMHQWLIGLRPKVANGGALAKAIDYTLKRWPALIRYAETGHLPVNNNPVENVIRPIAIGKNCGFFQAANAQENMLLLSKACSLRPNSMASNPPLG